MKLLGGPQYPPIVEFFNSIWCIPSLMTGKYCISHTMSKVMEKLQQAEIVDDVENFLIITEEDLEASVEENRNSCHGKILAERERNKTYGGVSSPCMVRKRFRGLQNWDWTIPFLF